MSARSWLTGQAIRLGLGSSVTTVLARLPPLTDLGRDAVAAYAARDNLTVDDYLARQPGLPLTPTTPDTP